MLETNGFAFIIIEYNILNSKDDTLKNFIQLNLKQKVQHQKVSSIQKFPLQGSKNCKCI